MKERFGIETLGTLWESFHFCRLKNRENAKPCVVGTKKWPNQWYKLLVYP